MTVLSTLAAAPDAVAPIPAAVLALASFLVLLFLGFTAGSAPEAPPTEVPRDASLEDQVGT